jgi:SAM-dependent methyltransferase
MSLFNSHQTDADWNHLGELDPYYAVLTNPEYTRAALDDAALEAFFQTGEKHIRQILDLIHSSFDPTFHPVRSLDFGCGVGRVLIPLARLSSVAAGIDISPAMLAEARRNCEARGLDNVEYILSDDRLSRLEGKYDFIHSFIVFQHIPRGRGEKILTELLAHLAEGGIIACQFYLFKRAPVWKRSINWLRRSIPLVHPLLNLIEGKVPGYPAIQMHPYDLGRILQIFNQAGCGLSLNQFTEHHANCGVVLVARKNHALAQPPY